MPIIGTIASSYRSGSPAPVDAYESIASVVTTGSQSAATFSSIPSTYKHLQVRFLINSISIGDFYKFNVNNDNTTTRYTTSMIYTNGSSNSNSQWLSSAGRAYWLFMVSSGIVQSTIGIADFEDYADTNKFKGVRLLYGSETSSGTSSRETGIMMGQYLQTTAINRIDFTMSSGGNLPANSLFALYGIKG